MSDEQLPWHFVQLERDLRYLPRRSVPLTVYVAQIYDPGQEKVHWEELTESEHAEFQAFIDRVIARVQEEGEP